MQIDEVRPGRRGEQPPRQPALRFFAVVIVAGAVAALFVGEGDDVVDGGEAELALLLLLRMRVQVFKQRRPRRERRRELPGVELLAPVEGGVGVGAAAERGEGAEPRPEALPCVRLPCQSGTL